MDPVLPVFDVAFDPNVEETNDISDMSVEEYLSWVRHQAKALPEGLSCTSYSYFPFI